MITSDIACIDAKQHRTYQGKVTTTLLGVACVTAGSVHVAEFNALQSPVQFANGGDPVDEAVVNVTVVELAL
jgi:hypothetical protein